MNKTLALGLTIIVAVGVGAAIFLYPRPGGGPIPDQAQKPDAGLPEVVKMDEAARAAYLAANVRVLDVKIEPDKKPDRDEVVHGLLRVSGTVVNSGQERLDQVFLSISPTDADGNVLSSFEENLARPVLAGGESRPFHFTIPADPKFGGTFQQKLH